MAEWFPQNERSLATGIFNSGANVGAILAPIIVPWVTLRYGWHAAFLTTGLFSALWILVVVPQLPQTLRAPYSYQRRTAAHLPGVGDGDGLHLALAPAAGLPPNLGLFDREVPYGSDLVVLSCSGCRLTLVLKFNLNLSHLGLPLIIVYNVSAIGSIGGGWLPAPFRRLGLSPNYARLAAMLFCACMVVPIFTATRLQVGVGRHRAAQRCSRRAPGMVRQSLHNILGHVSAQRGGRGGWHRRHGRISRWRNFCLLRRPHPATDA